MNSTKNYTNIATIEVTKLESYTPYMIIITATNQFGQMARNKTVYFKTFRDKFAIELTLKTTLRSSIENVMLSISQTLKVSIDRLIQVKEPLKL